MRPRKNWGSKLVVGAVMFCALLLLGAAVPGAPAPTLPPNPAGGVFTPAHASVLDAFLDFLGWRTTPVQPIAFPHKTHLANKLTCETCHMGVMQGPNAGIPDVRFCMSCHGVIAKDRPEIKKVAAYLASGQDIPWQRVYNYSDMAHVRFNHAPHIQAGVQCSSCHGDMTQQTVATRAVNLDMGYCLKCHQQRNVSVDCTVCHF